MTKYPMKGKTKKNKFETKKGEFILIVNNEKITGDKIIEFMKEPKK